MKKQEKPLYKRITRAREYQDANKDTVDVSNCFSDFKIDFGNIESFEVCNPIGSGKYSIVFYGYQNSSTPCAIKILKNVPMIKIQREVAILKMVQSIPNVVKLYDIVKDPLTGTVSIITEFFENESAKTLFPKLSVDQIRKLMYQLLTILDKCHSKGIMHRDVKPGNLLISPSGDSLRLIDWGLADLYVPENYYSVRVSTLRYKAPELLLNYQCYDYGVDIWGAGCVLAEMLWKCPFFEGRSIEEMVAEVGDLCGLRTLLEYTDKYGLVIPQESLGNIQGHPKNGWDRIIASIKSSKRDPDAIDLLKKLLEPDHEKRVTAREALEHKFFDPLRL